MTAKPGEEVKGAARKAQEPLNVFVVMEEVNDKLKVLNYETTFCKQK
jgi:hypothetical protein